MQSESEHEQTLGIHFISNRQLIQIILLYFLYASSLYKAAHCLALFTISVQGFHSKFLLIIMLHCDLHSGFVRFALLFSSSCSHIWSSVSNAFFVAQYIYCYYCNKISSLPPTHISSFRKLSMLLPFHY